MPWNSLEGMIKPWFSSIYGVPTSRRNGRLGLLAIFLAVVIAPRLLSTGNNATVAYQNRFWKLIRTRTLWVLFQSW